MDNIKVLEEIGLKKVCDETHIEQKYLKYMVDCDFDKLDYINTRGFVKILSREYKLDLDAWSEAFEEYWVDNREKQETRGLFIVVDDTKKSKKLLFFMTIVLFGAVLSIIFSFFQDEIDFLNYTSVEETSYEQSSLIQDTQSSLDEVNVSFEESLLLEDESVFEEINSTIEETVIVDDNISISSENIVKKDQNETKEPTEKISPRFSQEATIIPNSELWVGVIYLDSRKRRSFLGEGNFSIDISREQIITTGHGSFNIDIDGIQTEFKQQAPMKFLIKDMNITEISGNRFKELNEGESW